MPAYFDVGFTVREPAWHGLAHVFADYPGKDEAMVAAGHDFTLVERKVASVVTASSEEIAGVQMLDGWKAIAREDSGKVMHVAKNSYEIVQPSVLWDVADAIVAEPNVLYETGGILDDGRVLWVLARLDEPVVVPGDHSPIMPWVCVNTYNDGGGALTARGTSIRVVCQNTFSMTEAEGARTGREFIFRHTKNVMARIEEAKQTIVGVRDQHAAFIELATELAKLPVSARGVEFFTTEFIPKPPEALISDRVIKNVERARDEIRAVLAGPTINQDRGHYTAWDLLNVGGEYLDHVRRYRSKASLFGRQLLRDEPLKAKLLPLVREAAGV